MKCNVNRRYDKPVKNKKGDPRLVGIVDHIDELTVGPDDTFKFGCKMCGKCCTYRDDILLNAKDLFNLATALQLTPDKVVDQYCETYLGGTSRFPIIRLKSVGYDRHCPLLKDRKCSVHRLKPTVCAMFPVGRYISNEGDPIDPASLTTESVKYLVQPTDCGDGTETHTVREWFDAFGLSLEDEFFVAWQKMLTTVGPALQRLEKSKIGDQIFNQLCSLVYVTIYLRYDMEKDFMAQFEDNAARIIAVVETLEKGVAENKEFKIGE